MYTGSNIGRSKDRERAIWLIVELLEREGPRRTGQIADELELGSRKRIRGLLRDARGSDLVRRCTVRRWLWQARAPR